MFARPVRNGEATGLAVRPGASVVRLRTSPVERLALVLRTILGVAFGFAVLWAGGIFLSCTATTAAAVPVQTVVYGAVKGGKDRAAGGRATDSPLVLLAASGDGGDSDGGDSGGGDSDKGDSDEKKSDEKDSDEKKDSDEEKSDKKDSDDEKKSDKKKSDEKDSEKKDSEKKDSEKKDSEKESEKKESDENESGEKDSGDSSPPSDDSKKDDSNVEKAEKVESRGEDSDDEKPAAEERDDSDEDRESDEPGRSQPESSDSAAHQGNDADAPADDEQGSEPAGTDESTDSSGEGDDAAADRDREDYDKIAEEQPSSDPRESRDEDGSEGADSDAADRETGDGDRADLAESATDLAEDISDEATERAQELVEELTREESSAREDDDDDEKRDAEEGDAASQRIREALDEHSDAEAGSDESGSDSVSVLAAKVTDLVDGAVEDADRSDSDSDDSRSDAEEAAWEQLLTETADALDAGEEQDVQQVRRSAGEPADPRGPPAETVGLFSSDEDDADESRKSDEDDDRDDDDDDDKDYDDSPELTEQVLEDRIEVDNSKDELEREKAKLTAGETSQADYDKKAAEHAEREREADERRDELSPDRVELVDEVVDGHRELSKREKELAAEEEQVTSGTADRDTHDKNVADYEKRRDDVYESTDELMDATDREVRTVSDDDLDGEGAAAGCDSDGAFVGCGSASESADGERDSERKLCLSGVSHCGASSESGGSKAEASCDDTGCGSSASSRGADGTENRSSARCDGAARDCGQSSKADREGASAECESGGGTCRSDSSGSGRDSEEPDGRDTVRLASADESTKTRVSGSSSARCESATGCGTSSRVDVGEDGDVVADAETGCDTGCTGSASTRSDASVVAATSKRESATAANADCSVNGGSCSAHSGSQADSEDGDLAASSTAGGSVDCDTACTGSATGTTNGKTTGSPAVAGAAAPVRETSATSSCTASAGGCSAESASEVGDAAAESRSVRNLDRAADGTLVFRPVERELTATSQTGVRVECAVANCSGAGSSTTSGAASGDIVGVRDSTGSSSCTAHGAGASCAAGADTEVADREPVSGDAAVGPSVTGPVSVSNTSATVTCSGGRTECGGTTASSTSARDTAVTPHARGTSAASDCIVTGGDCSGESSSKASSAPDFVMIDPATGKPVAGQATTGPSSTSSSSAALNCPNGCTGTVHTSTSAWDGAVAGGAPRTSNGTASCTGGTSACDVRSVSTASTGPGAAQALAAQSQAGTAQSINAARLVPGPSAASAAGAALTCAGQQVCTGTATSAATATDPTVSPDARGSHSTASCEGVSGAVCQAVSNSAASSGPDANSIAPLVQARSTDNATVSSGTTGDQAPQQQPGEPATPLAPAAPGSSANSGGPTVPGASSWTMASATLDCQGGTACTGTARTSASGSDGPAVLNGAGEARGPPEGASTTSASCASGRSGCQAHTSSTAGSGQVVADIIAEQQNDAAEQAEQQARQAEQLAAQAAKVAARPGATPEQQKTAADAVKAAAEARKVAVESAELAAEPVTDAPAALAQSSATAQCAGPGCTATTTGDTSGLVGASHSRATCAGACMISSDATAMTYRDSGQRSEGGEAIPGYSASGETGSSLLCRTAGCTGTVSGNASAKIEQGSVRSTSTGAGDTACDGTSPCEAGIRITTSVAATAPHVDDADRFAATAVTVAGSCDNGTQGGCAIRATSSSDVTGAAGVHATTTTACTAGGGCMAGTTGTASPDLAEVGYQCVGVGGCTGHSEGTAAAGTSTANASSDCTVGGNGECAGSSTVGASADGSAMAGASCQGSAGAACRFHFEAASVDSSRAGSSSAKAHAHGSMTGEFGGGVVQVMAKAHAEGSGAQAQASCQGTAGVQCGYHFEATASASSRSGASWANAYAHGSETGGMGGGAVQVMAQASASGADAQAQAMCIGAKNCTSRYAAHAEAHDRLDQKANPSQPDMASGYWSAHGAGTCRGSGNGGCGVHAWANAGPGGSGGAVCSGDCSNFVQEQGGPSTFTKTGPSWNEMQAARIHQVKNLDEVIAGLKPEDSFIGYKAGEDGYTVYTKEPGGEVKSRPCPATECKPGHTIPTSNGKITFPEQGNPQASQQSAPGHADHTCDASVGCALTNHGNGNSDYWLEGDGAVGDGITGSTMSYKNNQPVGGGPAHLNEGSFGNTKGKPFVFTCNGGCKGSVSNLDLGKGKFTDQIDLEGTRNLLIGRDGLGNLGDYSHEGLGTITLMKRDGSMMEPIVSGNDAVPGLQETSGLTPGEWADVVTKYGHTPWDIETITKVLEPGDSLIGYRENADGSYTVYVKEPNGEVEAQPCPASKCRPGGEFPGGNGKVTFPNQGDPTATQRSAPGHADNTCTARVSCGLATDGNGNGMWWMQGNGNVHDGISGSTVNYYGNPAESRNGGNWSNTQGTPFTASCADGCSGDIGFGDKKDHFELDNATGVLLTSRDAFGNSGRITWAGTGHFVSAEGDKVWADLTDVAYDVNNEDPKGRGPNPADDTTLIVTRDAAGNPGYYALPTGQTGRIETIEGYVVDNRHGDLIDPSNVDYNFGHERDTLAVTTPDGNGKGGVLTCDGRCTVTGPGLNTLNTPCERCSWTEHLATGEGPHPGGWREVENRAEGAKTWYTPTGDELTCDGCFFVQYNRDANGNGGGAVCSGTTTGGGMACSGKSREGTAVSDAEGLRMLYANADGSHQGYSCASNSKTCGNRPELQFDWKGNPDETWALPLNPGYLRPSTGTQMDKDLAAKLGRDEDDLLPPLTADALAHLEKTDPDAAKRYKDSLPVMSGGESAEMGFTYLERQSTDRRLQQQYGPIYDEKIKPVLDAYKAANADNHLDPVERRDLEAKFKTLEGIDPGLIYEWSSARGVIDGVDDATWVRPDIAEVQAQLGSDPKMVEEMAGPEPTRLQDPQYGMTPMERAMANARRDLGIDGNGAFVGPYNMNQNALLSFRPRQTALDLTTAGHMREVADYNRQADAFNANPVSAAEQQRLADWKNRLDQRWSSIVGERGTLENATAGLKGQEDQARQARLRELDGRIGRATGDRLWSDRLTSANEQLIAIQEMRGSLDRNDPQQKAWAETLDALGGLAALNYTATSRNLEEREDGNPLGRLSLPSTGKPDFYFAMVAGKNLPEYDAYQGALKESWKDLTRDQLANEASKYSVAEAEAGLRDRTLRNGERPTGNVLKAVEELGGEGYLVDAERMLYRHGDQKVWQPMLVYRVRDDDGNVVGFVDLTGTHYSSLTDFRNVNGLPDDSHLITRGDWTNDDSALTLTTAHHTSGFEKAMDYVIAPGAIVVGAVTAPFVPPVGAGLIGFGAGYFLGKSIGNVVVRAQHGQSNGFDNPAAVADYVTMGATAFFGVGSLVRPIAATAAGAALRGSAQVAVGGMTAYSAVNTVINWDSMTRGQQRDTIIGLAGGVALTLTPMAARGVGAVFKPRVSPGATLAGKGGTFTEPGLAFPSIMAARPPLATAKLGAQVRAVLEELGADNGRGGRMMASTEVAAALRARGIRVPSEAALRDAINSTPGIDYIGDPSIGGIVRTGAGQFAGMRMSLDDSTAQPTRQQVADLLDRAGWPEAIRDGELSAAKVDQLADPTVFREIKAAQEHGQIRGMSDWLKYNAGKAPDELAEAARELGDARWLANENPGMVVKVGREQNAPRRANGDPMQEFDLSVETPGGQIKSVAEVTILKDPLIRAPQLTSKVRHAADKVATRLRDGKPVEGSPEAIVHVRLPDGSKRTKGGSMQVLEDGTIVRLKPDGSPIESSKSRNSGNLFDDIENHLSASDINQNVDRVTLVVDGKQRIVFVRQGETWKRQGVTR